MDLAAPPSQLPDSLRLRRHLHVGGKWTSPADVDLIDVENPSTGNWPGRCPPAPRPT